MGNVAARFSRQILIGLSSVSNKWRNRSKGPVRRIVGFVKAKTMLQLFYAADLEVTPRSAKAGPVTLDIIESITQTPETFPIKTKGVLVSASNYESLQRNRYELRFENTKIEGILDGGHNMLAMGTYVLAKALGDDRLIRKIKRWPDLKSAWIDNRDAIETFRKSSAEESDGTKAVLDFLVPIEILVRLISTMTRP